jgi:hypothetical protein
MTPEILPPGRSASGRPVTSRELDVGAAYKARSMRCGRARSPDTGRVTDCRTRILRGGGGTAVICIPRRAPELQSELEIDRDLHLRQVPDVAADRALDGATGTRDTVKPRIAVVLRRDADGCASASKGVPGK